MYCSVFSVSLIKSYSLQRVHNPEGYTNTFNNSYASTNFFYYRRDHLGNTREVWRAPYTVYASGNTTALAAVVQRTQYYPSGLPWSEGLGASVQNKKYNGKEFVEMNGLDEYDSSARMYYPAGGRTLSIDPLAEKYYSISPYAWCGNNPVNAIDPDGRVVIFVNGQHGGTGGKREYWGGTDTQENNWDWGQANKLYSLAQYDHIDLNGNPLSIVEKESLNSVYLWSYNGQFPIAEIKNATYEQVVGVLGQSLINRISASLVPLVTDLASVNALRSSTLLPNALVTTYTYKPLVGILTATDPRGVVTKYEYDDFGRLITKKDNSDKLLQSIEYNYKH